MRLLQHHFPCCMYTYECLGWRENYGDIDATSNSVTVVYMNVQLLSRHKDEG